MIALGKRLAQLRRDRGVTQEMLAQHVGVTKAAVSKWENEQSLPDVAMLPVLAAYFDVSVDALLDYHAHLPREALRQFHQRMTAQMAHGQMEEALREIRETARRYYADAPTLIECALLLINHTEQEWIAQADTWLERACEIGSPSEVRQATCLHACCLMGMGRAQEAIACLKPLEEDPISLSQLLAQAYQQAGDAQQAVMQIQWTAYCALMDLASALGFWAMLPGAPTAQLMEQVQAMETAFSLRQLHPVILLSAYAQGAIGFLGMGDQDAALNMLENYIRIAQKDILSPVMLRTRAPFDAIDQRLDELPNGKMPPVDEALVRERVIASVTTHPAFTLLQGDARYEALIARLKMQI